MKVIQLFISKMKKYKINEIFYSLQGEGRHTGMAAIFIRFSGCNLKCPFCDTQHNEGQEMSIEEICAEVNKYPTPIIILTGGEPSLFIDEEFIAYLKTDTGKQIAIETNGTRELPANLDWVTLSPKDQFTAHADVVLKKCDELKVVFPCDDLDKYSHILARNRYLQPCDTQDAERNAININKCVEYIKNNPQWQLSLQTQKILGVR